MLTTIIGALLGIVVALPLTIVPMQKFIRPRNQKMYFCLSLIPIALFYVGFSYYYGNLAALYAEIVAVIIFVVFALLGQLMATRIIAYGYILHGIWDLLHEMFIAGFGVDIPWSEVPPGYAAFCLVYDLIIAAYVFKNWQAWDADA